MTATLLLVRNGETDWNLTDRHLGWADVALTAAGLQEGARCGALMRLAGTLPDVVHTSLLRRSIGTAERALDACDRQWIPVRRSWRLNERHYGALQGRDEATVRAQFGEEAVALWRNSPHIAPPPLPDEDEFSQAGDPRYGPLLDARPRTESIADVRARLLPYFYDAILRDLRVGTVLVASHGNPLRVLIAHLQALDLDAVKAYSMPAGVPLRYELDPTTMRPIRLPDYLDGVTAPPSA